MTRSSFLQTFVKIHPGRLAGVVLLAAGALWAQPSWAQTAQEPVTEEEQEEEATQEEAQEEPEERFGEEITVTRSRCGLPKA